MGEKQQAALELMEKSSSVSILMVGVPRRGRGPVTAFPQNLVMLLSIAVLIAFSVTTSLEIYELYENSKGVSSP